MRKAWKWLPAAVILGTLLGPVDLSAQWTGRPTEQRHGLGGAPDLFAGLSLAQGMTQESTGEKSLLVAGLLQGSGAAFQARGAGAALVVVVPVGGQG